MVEGGIILQYALDYDSLIALFHGLIITLCDMFSFHRSVRMTLGTNYLIFIGTLLYFHSRFKRAFYYAR